MTIVQPSYIFSAWEEYEKWQGMCPDCNWTGLLADAIFEYETAMISSLHCPKCDRKLALMGNQATQEQLCELASRGSAKAIQQLKINENPPE